MTTPYFSVSSSTTPSNTTGTIGGMTGTTVGLGGGGGVGGIRREMQGTEFTNTRSGPGTVTAATADTSSSSNHPAVASTDTTKGGGGNANFVQSSQSRDSNRYYSNTTTSLLSSNNHLTMSMPSLHMDYIHDIQYDYYGRRLATCSADRFIRVWDLNELGEWKSHKGFGEWQAHRGTVNSISWAHPEYGQLLASCGSDHSVIIWEERERPTAGGTSTSSNDQQTQTQTSPPVLPVPPTQDPSQQQQQQQQGNTNTNTTTSHWVSKATLVDAKQSVTCVQFAPHHLGLKIASGSADGYVRIHEAIDVMNLLHWSLTSTIHVVNATNPKKSDQEKSHSLLSNALGTSVARANTYDLGVTALSWCNGRFESSTLVVGTGQGDLYIYKYSDQTRTWNISIKLPSHDRSILSVSWAPNVGRSYHLIASAGKDRTLRVHKLNRHRSSTTTGGGSSSGGGTSSSSTPSRNSGGTTAGGNTLELESSQILSTSNKKGSSNEEVWKCVWNVTGTVLASSGDGGIVYLWKSDFLSKHWTCVGEVMGATSSSSTTSA